MEKELDMLTNSAEMVTSFLINYGFQIVGAIITLIIGFIVARWTGNLVAGLCNRANIDITLGRFAGSIVKGIVIVFVVIIALGKFGINISPLIAALGAMAFGGTLALQGPLSNYGAGISIILSRPFVVGNTITVQGVSGVVEEIRLGITLLITEDGEKLTIPNKKIVDEILINSDENRIVELVLGISYDSDADEAILLIHKALSEIDSVVKTPIPQVGIQNFADSSVELGIRYWVPTNRYFETLYQANQSIYKVIKSAGIIIPYPQREVRMLDT